MPSAPPSAVLSEAFQAHLEGRRVRTAVFLTFSFEPGFFEQQILPVFLDVPLSQADAVRMVQLEDVVRGVDHVAVYYDPRGLIASGESPRLDVRRIPAVLRDGFFHPKNVFLITEPVDPEDPVARTLIVATLSANLTQAGWWENVECCHIETVEDGAAIGFRDDLLGLLRATRAASPDDVSHDALDKVRDLVSRCSQRQRQSEEQMPARLFGGRGDFVQFIDEATRGRLHELNLEVISPYFDDAEAAPLRELIDKLKPRECRVFLPRDKDGTVACPERHYEAVRKMAPACWSLLPKATLQKGRTDKAGERVVHAKVYRFFHPHRRYEAIVVGSVNLTSAAHRRGGNVESAFVIETALSQVPDWWMSRTEGKKPTAFQEAGEGEDVSTTSPAVWLTLTYYWDQQRAEVQWRNNTASPEFELFSAGVSRLKVGALAAGEKRVLGEAEAKSIREGLDTTALFIARVGGSEDGPLLVREEGMAMKPSILLTLSVADILRYWSALTREQRLAILENAAFRDPAIAGALSVAIKESRSERRDSFFDNFAQIFQAFENVEHDVRRALEAEREKEAIQRLLGEKYDSLPCLLTRILQADRSADAVSKYLIVLCARQVLEQTRNLFPDFARAHRQRFDELLAMTKTSGLRAQLDLAGVEQPGNFLDWFETWFVRRAEPSQEPA
jgi:hypothetical protein